MKNEKHIEVWSNCLKVIKDNVPPMTFRTWFMPINPKGIENDTLTLEVPSHFFYEYLEEHFINILKMTLQKEMGPKAKLEYDVLVKNNSFANGAITLNYPETNKYVTKNKEANVPKGSNPIKNPFVIPGIQKVHIDPQLNPNYTFENFIEGECNRLARSAGLTLAKKPGQNAFNPLFLYSEPGMGKTHLAQAIGIEIKKQHKDKVVLFVDANLFSSQYINPVKNNETQDFLHFYKMVDVLILDDVQLMAGKAKTQEHFFMVFNHLHQSQKQLILTSDKPSVEIVGFEQRLLSRFKWGLSAEITKPDYETRMAILRHKLHQDGIQIDEEVVEFIAKNVQSNVRELEGSLISLLANATLTKKQITLELAQHTIARLVKYRPSEYSVHQIQRVVCDYFELDMEEMQAKTRKRTVVQARQIAMFLSKKHTDSSLASIGSQIGGKDHATVLHACRTVVNLLETDKDFKNHVDQIQRRLNEVEE